jgi:hypothetical protein
MLLELLLKDFAKMQITNNHIIFLGMVIIYYWSVLYYKYRMRNHPKDKKPDGSKKYR